MNACVTPGAAGLHEPVRNFCGSHARIFGGLDQLRGVAALADAARAARQAAQAMIALFDEGVPRHHEDEEKELFVAVLRSARGTADEAHVDELVSRLTAEHRRVERLWSELRPAMRAVAAGKDHDHPNFARATEELAHAYCEHACLEEEAFLPLADRVLARNPHHLEALDVSLHIRHAPMPRLGYV